MSVSGYFSVGFYLLLVSLFIPSGVAATSIVADTQNNWLASVHAAWAEQDKEFKTSSTSPLAGVSRFEITATGTVYFVEQDDALGWSLDAGENQKFSLFLVEGNWKWMALDAGVTVVRVDEVLKSGSLLQAGDELSVGRFTLAVYPSYDRITVLVFDADSQKMKNFETLERFEPNKKFAVTAKIVPFQSPDKIELITGRQQIKQRFKYALLKFEIDGEKLQLTAYKNTLEGEHSEVLFVPFTDKTTGKYSYGGGRYLIVDEPSAGNKVEIDFNMVTNPLCNYADIYNCIVPSRENKLPIEVLAGEKKYH
ncbi:MAG: DUF1684 domain-containing protein [Proteobacteria bacterium]|nr:DUF1684 domain-containing protein [Pseudomonadota bacterium]